VTVAELVRSLAEHCQEQVEGRHVLAVSDSSEINLQSHAGRLKPLALIAKQQSVTTFDVKLTLMSSAVCVLSSMSSMSSSVSVMIG